jgi:hypothetical protein
MAHTTLQAPIGQEHVCLVDDEPKAKQDITAKESSRIQKTTSQVKEGNVSTLNAHKTRYEILTAQGTPPPPPPPTITSNPPE